MKSVRIVWLLVLVVVVGSLVASEATERAPRTNAERVNSLAGDFACPVCQGQSLAESEVPVARTIRAAVRTMVDEGRTDDEVRSMLVTRFGEQVDYTPSGRGLTGLVWVLPIVAGALALVAVASALRRWADADTKPEGGSRTFVGRPMTLIGVVALAVLAGILVARAAGDRSSTDALTGDIRSSTRTMLAEAAVAAPTEAEVLYTEVLEIQPSNVEALAYRGWSRWRVGQRDVALSDLDEAVVLDAGYPDVRVFRASARNAIGDYAGAAEDLLVLDGLDAPPIVYDLLSASRLRQRIAGGLAQNGELLFGIELLDSGLDAAAGGDRQAGLLAERGWLLAATRIPELVESGLANLDEAVAADPKDPYARVYRAVVRNAIAGMPEGAAADVEVFSSMVSPPPNLLDLMRSAGLTGE